MLAGLGNGSSSSSHLGGIDSAVGGVAVGLNVDAWVQFEGFRGFERALKGLRGRVMQHRNAELLCEYQLGVDVTGYMTHEQCREREIARAEEARKVRDSNELSCLKLQLCRTLSLPNWVSFGAAVQRYHLSTSSASKSFVLW